MTTEMRSEIDKIFMENQSRISNAIIMDLVDELIDLCCDPIAEQLEIQYEEAENHLLHAKFKIKKQLQEMRRFNAD